MSGSCLEKSNPEYTLYFEKKYCDMNRVVLKRKKKEKEKDGKKKQKTTEGSEERKLAKEYPHQPLCQPCACCMNGRRTDTPHTYKADGSYAKHSFLIFNKTRTDGGNGRVVCLQVRVLLAFLCGTLTTEHV